jgi:hypothetical protein
VLLIESGSRSLFENLIPGIYGTYGDDITLDLVTCFAGVPEGLNPATSTVFRITDYPGVQGRLKLLSELRSRNHLVVGIICSAEPIMAKWKWWLAWKLPAKVFVLNENGDYFWLDRFHWGVILHFALYRAGLTGAGAVPTLARLLLFPLTLRYLLMFAGLAHLKRWVRMRA